MDIVNLDKDVIKPNPENPRSISKNQLKKLVEGIKKFGLVQPLIVDDQGVIIGGHQRYTAGLEAGLISFPCVVLQNLTESEKLSLNIGLNRISGDWDEDKLTELLKRIKTEEAESLTFAGFDDYELMKRLREDAEVNDDTVEVNAYERAKNKGTVKLNDLYILGRHRLMCGDSTNSFMVQKLFGDHKPTLMVTDPPYGVNYSPEWRDEADKKGVLGNKYPTRSMGKVENDDKIDWSEAYKLFPGNVMYVWHAGRYASEVAKSIESVDFEIISQIIWVKPHFALSRGDYHWQHEPCWYANRKGQKHEWQGSRTESTVWQIKGMNAMGHSTDEEDTVQGHGTQKPLECMARPVRNNTEKGGVVYDPFGGSGTTLIACEKIDRSCLMMELNPDYVQLIIDRWEKLTNLKAVKA